MKIFSMKRFVIVMLLGAMLAAGAQTSMARDREWAVAGKVLTGVAVASVLSQAFAPPPAVVYAPPPVVYGPPPVVYRSPPVVYQQPVYVAPAPVYFRPAPVYRAPVPVLAYPAPRPYVYCRPRYHGRW